MKFTDTLDHICITNADLLVHQKHEFFACRSCANGLQGEAKLHVTRPTAEKLKLIDKNGAVLCPDCGEQMDSSGPQHHGELHGCPQGGIGS